MAGKSNVIDVFRFLRAAFLPEPGAYGVAYALAQRGGVGEVLWKGGDEKLISIGLEFSDESQPEARYRYLIEMLAGAGNFVTLQRESLTLFRASASCELIKRNAGAVSQVNSDGSEVGGVVSGHLAMQYASRNWEGYKLYDYFRLSRFYSLVPAVMKEPSLMALGEVLSPHGENLSAWLMWLQTNSPESFGRLNEVIRDLFPDVLQLKTIPSPDGKVHLAVVEKGLKRPTTVWQASDGLLALVALLSLIYSPPELSGTLFCIEEPENHLHPRLLESLVSLFRQVRQELGDSKSPLSQVIISTQSPFLLDQLTLDEIIWVEKRNGETHALHPADKENLRRLVQNKELGLGDLMFTGALGGDK
jgi:predicted ATPase